MMVAPVKKIANQADDSLKRELLLLDLVAALRIAPSN
jgi:hypothetical protein